MLVCAAERRLLDSRAKGARLLTLVGVPLRLGLGPSSADAIARSNKIVSFGFTFGCVFFPPARRVASMR